MSRHRARTITTASGKFMHCEDCKRALMDDEFVKECMAVFKVGVETYKDTYVQAFRCAIGNAFMELAGEGGESETQPRRRE